MQLNELNIVAIGGGHGLGRVLSTLSFMGDKLTGIVTTTDNGGSTGKLRKRSSSIAWGDLRNCLTELVEDDSVGSKLFNFRFDGSDELGGHMVSGHVDGKAEIIEKIMEGDAVRFRFKAPDELALFIAPKDFTLRLPMFWLLLFLILY